VREGRFREDLLARLDLWTFELPGLAQRREDIPPNIDYELQRHARTSGDHVTFNKEARTSYLSFAASLKAKWLANFRDLGASITRMATLAPA
ncbi:sigma 54-dependent transcriptional regulator, partial [Vibrio parahaemolyticus]